MTLEELLGRRGLCGRALKIHDTTGYAWRGTVKRVWTEGILVHFLLVNYARQFEAERGPWKNLPNQTFMLGKNTPVETADDGTISFLLPNGGGRGYFPPKGKGEEER